ncbi:hypothetical protein [Algoriphagus sp. CAU 1675]|uniref:hypothetical protein n=1 Tax=Algoriphagus sp. CAU 1675 TaxID=3032597 RepID=UPI0023DC4D1B|nr:hypothetical protein [Algoriphagus sp. CAU 1675]MDF2158140.1 hypothetical protein [Algoriphagus sp. CAU 1675]
MSPILLDSYDQVNLKIISISLLILMTLPGTLILTVLHFRQESVKSEVKAKLEEGIEEDRLLILKFSRKESEEELRWEHEREFEYRGEMYDIVSSEITGDSVIYTVWWDQEETALKKKIEEVSNSLFGEGPLDHDSLDVIQNFYRTLYLPIVFGHFFSVLDTPESHFSTYVFNWVSLVVSPIFMPPKLS